MMTTGTLDPLDRKLAEALQINPRIPMRALAAVLEVSENTAARRYRRLRAAGAVRVAGVVNGAALGYNSWTVRLRATPEAAHAIARSLAAREDTSWVYLLSGGTEISCNIQERGDTAGGDLLMRKLPRTAHITAISAHLLLRSTALPGHRPETATLTAAQIKALQPPGPAGSATTTPHHLDEADHALLQALSQDGRAGYPQLAAATRRSESTTRRRVGQLHQAGILTFMTDVPARLLGTPVETRIWMNVQPPRLDSIAAELATHTEVSFVALTTGPTNLIASVSCHSTADLADYLTQRIGHLHGVTTIETAPILVTLKRASAAA